MDTANKRYKPDLVVFGEHFCAITNALGICKFSTVEECCLLPEDLAPAVAAMLGRDLTAQDLLRAGERIGNLERMYNVHQGLTRADDRPPPRFTEEPLPLHGYEMDPQTGDAIMEPEPMRIGLVQDLDAMLIVTTPCVAGRATACHAAKPWRAWTCSIWWGGHARTIVT